MCPDSSGQLMHFLKLHNKTSRLNQTENELKLSHCNLQEKQVQWGNRDEQVWQRIGLKNKMEG